MNILIICSYFPPDLSIGAIRPFMFSKYLVEFGNNVTVLCSKKTSNNLKDTLYNPNSIGANVIYYDFEDDTMIKNIAPNRKKFSFLSGPIYNSLSKLYHKFFYFNYYSKNYKTFNIEKEKKFLAIDNMHLNKFDVIFATFPNLEDLYAGQYAKRKFKSKLILDFRDMIVGSALENWYNNKYMLKYEQELVHNADYITCVSNDSANEIVYRYGIDNIEVINNGFDESNFLCKQGTYDDVFRVCYTGGLKLSFQQRMIGLLINVLSRLIKKNLIDKRYIEFNYAGNDSKIFKEIVVNNDLYGITKDFGLLTREETYSLQDKSDLFVVPSINTKDVKGIISGKFYEGVRMKKAILSMVDGDKPNSELYQMFENYEYGFCYEHITHGNKTLQLAKFIECIYNYKHENKQSKIFVSDNMYNDFSYRNLTKKLEDLCFSLIN